MNVSQRPFSSCCDLESMVSQKNLSLERDAAAVGTGIHHNWTLSDALFSNAAPRLPKLPMFSFNHISREVLNIEKSRQFYVDILGFEEVPRPGFDFEGYWLTGYGLNLHLILTTVPKERQKIKLMRIEYFHKYLPRVDHVAFISNDLKAVQEVLDRENVYYKVSEVGSEQKQIFLFDPDGNVIEIASPPPIFFFSSPAKVKDTHLISASQLTSESKDLDEYHHQGTDHRQLSGDTSSVESVDREDSVDQEEQV